MLDVENMSLEELLAKEREYGSKAYEYQRLADACCRERVRRDTAIMLRLRRRQRKQIVLQAAKAAQERARIGVCTQGVGDCPVHQMGSCQYLDPEFVKEILREP